MSLRPNPLAGLTRMIYGPGVSGLNEMAVLNTHGVPFSIVADLEIGDAGGDGVLAAIGGTTCGWSLYVKDGKPAFTYNFFAVEETRVASAEVLSKGKASVRVDVTPVAPGLGKPADVALFVNGKQVASGRVPRTAPFRYSTEPFDVGRDTVSAVAKDYRAPFAFQGRLEQVRLEVR